MEYDKTIAGGEPEAKSYPHESVISCGKDGKLRVKGPKADVSALGEPLKFAFSGRTAKNRFLKVSLHGWSIFRNCVSSTCRAFTPA